MGLWKSVTMLSFTRMLFLLLSWIPKLNRNIWRKLVLITNFIYGANMIYTQSLFFFLKLESEINVINCLSQKMDNTKKTMIKAVTNAADDFCLLQSFLCGACQLQVLRLPNVWCLINNFSLFGFSLSFLQNFNIFPHPLLSLSLDLFSPSLVVVFE